MKSIILVIALCTSLAASAQKLVLTKSSFTVNGIALTENSSQADVIKVLGKPTQTVDVYGLKHLTYTAKGFVVALDKETGTLHSISLIYVMEEKNAKPFAGTLTISGTSINTNTLPEVLEKIENLKVYYHGETGEDARIGTFEVSFFYANKKTSCKTVTIFLSSEED